MANKLTRAFRSFDKSVEKSQELIPAEIGIVLGGARRVLVPNREPFVYVRLRSNPSEVIEAYNDKVSPSYKLPVLLKRENNRYVVFSRDDGRYQNWEDENPFLPRHGDTHSFDKDGGNVGSDPVFVYPYQFIPALVSPFGVAGAENLFIFPTTINFNGDWKYVGNTGTPSLTQYNPSSGSTVLLVSMDALTGNPYIQATTGTYIPSSATGTADILSYLPSNEPRYLPLTAVRLVSGTTSVGWNNLYDVRQFLPSTPTGTAGGSSSSSADGFRFGVGGRLVPITNVDMPLIVSSPLEIHQWRVYLEYPGLTGSSIFDINKNGTTVFTNQANRPIVASGTDGKAISGIADIISFVAGDVITLDIDSVASGAYGLSAVASINTPITVTATSGFFKYDGEADPTFTYTTSLPVTLSGALSRDAGESGGVYNITQGTLTAPLGYEIVFVSATFAIASTLTPSSASVIDTWAGSAANLIDFNDATYWESSTRRDSQPWFKIDLGSAKTIKRVRLLQDATSWIATQFKVETSLDNSTWTTQFTSASGLTTAEHFVTLAFTSTRYIRITCTAGGGGSGWRVYSGDVKGY